MTLFSFLHAGDIHLDSPLKGLDADAPPLVRTATREALKNLVTLAIDESVKFVVLAGDIYDGDWPDYKTGLFFNDCMRELDQREIPVFMVHGNHDAASKITKSLPRPKNVYVFPHKEAKTKTIDPLQVAVHGRSFPQRDVPEGFVASYPPPKEGWFNLGVLHTSLDGDKDHDPYAPCTVDYLASRGYDYWALGHIHQRRIKCSASPVIVYPGIIQGRHVRETEPKGCFIATVNDVHRVDLAFHPLDVVRWEVLECRLTGEASLETAVGMAVESAKALIKNAADRLLAARLIVRGPTALHPRFQSHRIDSVAQFRAGFANEFGDKVWLEAVRFETSPPHEAEKGLSLPEDALTELQAVLAELRGDRSKFGDALKELEKLNEKLPEPLRTGAEPMVLTDPTWAMPLLDRVLPLLADSELEQAGTE